MRKTSLKKTLGILVIWAFCAITMVLGFALPSYAAVIDSAEYKPEVMPDTIVKTWDKGASGGQVYIQYKALYIDTTQDNTTVIVYFRTIPAQHSTDTITIEAKVKLHQYTSIVSPYYAGGCGIWWADEATSNEMTIYPDRIALYFPYVTPPNMNASYSMNTTDAYHVYKIVATGPTDNVKVYVDGGSSPVIDINISPGWGYDRNWVMFGDGSTSDGALASWEYINYQVER